MTPPPVPEPVRAWALVIDGEIAPEWIASSRAWLQREAEWSPSADERIIRVEVRPVPLKRNPGGKADAEELSLIYRYIVNFGAIATEKLAKVAQRALALEAIEEMNDDVQDLMDRDRGAS